jgi:hypothetical protein
MRMNNIRRRDGVSRLLAPARPPPGEGGAHFVALARHASRMNGTRKLFCARLPARRFALDFRVSQEMLRRRPLMPWELSRN